MKLKRTVLLLTVVVTMGLLLGASAAQAFEVEVDETGTNATAIRNLEFNGELYDVTFLYSSTDDIWGDEAFDFDDFTVAADAVVAVNDALNTVPEVVTVGPESGEQYALPFAQSGIFVDVQVGAQNSTDNEWVYSGSSYTNVATTNETYAKFSQVSIVVPAPVPKTGQTESVLPGDDGDLQLGVTSPDPRFTDNDDGTVTDNLTNLIWLRNYDCWPVVEQSWSSALDACANLADGQCGLVDGSSAGDWRLPNLREFLSLIDYGNIGPALPSGHPFVRLGEVNLTYYWTSTALSETAGVGVWVAHLWYGSVTALFQFDKRPRVWPVRGGNDGF